jgi:hypothetical protein
MLSTARTIPSNVSKVLSFLAMQLPQVAGGPMSSRERPDRSTVREFVADLGVMRRARCEYPHGFLLRSVLSEVEG